ncbi:MAG TPA: DUF2306 domain-containing protein [Pseudonocardia sp.]|uniref:DUF2306 domain-containing protein n=1 Tax=Pseudonocardia sp. TaxID=60912 RepID=UPI002F40189E
MTSPSRRARSVLTRPWVGPLEALTAVFLVVSLPRYLTPNPALSRSVPPADFPPYYPLLVTHIFFGAFALVLQLWPRLRHRHPAVHRGAGRVYAVAVLVASPCVLAIAPFGSWGPSEWVSVAMLGMQWPATTIAGYRTARLRRLAEHREWMIRSVALSFSIVADRFWGMLCVAVFAPDVPDAAALPGMPGHREFAQAMSISVWLSWTVNLLFAEWWILRTRSRKPTCSGSAHRGESAAVGTR